MWVSSQFAQWQIRHEPDLTRKCFAKSTLAKVLCNCNTCRNFAALGMRPFPEGFQSIAYELGLDLAKPGEVIHYNREPTGLHLMGGWFHFVGCITSGEGALDSTLQETLRYEALGDHFGYAFTSRVVCITEEFRPHQLAQLEITAQVPWILSEPEPD